MTSGGRSSAARFKARSTRNYWRLRKLERQQDLTDGKALEHTFDSDGRRSTIRQRRASRGVALRDIKEDALRRKERGPSLRRPVSKKSSQGLRLDDVLYQTAAGVHFPRLLLIDTSPSSSRTWPRRSRTFPTRRRRRRQAKQGLLQRADRAREHAGPAAKAGGEGLSVIFVSIYILQMRRAEEDGQ